jgi:hypothetical protein
VPITFPSVIWNRFKAETHWITWICRVVPRKNCRPAKCHSLSSISRLTWIEEVALPYSSVKWLQILGNVEVICPTCVERCQLSSISFERNSRFAWIESYTVAEELRELVELPWSREITFVDFIWIQFTIGTNWITDIWRDIDSISFDSRKLWNYWFIWINCICLHFYCSTFAVGLGHADFLRTTLIYAWLFVVDWHVSYLFRFLVLDFIEDKIINLPLTTSLGWLECFDILVRVVLSILDGFKPITWFNLRDIQQNVPLKNNWIWMLIEECLLLESQKWRLWKQWISEHPFSSMTLYEQEWKTAVNPEFNFGNSIGFRTDVEWDKCLSELYRNHPIVRPRIQFPQSSIGPITAMRSCGQKFPDDASHLNYTQTTNSYQVKLSSAWPEDNWNFNGLLFPLLSSVSQTSFIDWFTRFCLVYDFDRETASWKEWPESGR